MSIEASIHLKSLIGGYRRVGYSQEGEDLVLNRYFEAYPRLGAARIYVEIGAHHPIRFSNTYFFYKRGWRGLTVEPNPAMERIFRWLRPMDTHVTAAIGLVKETADYFQFSDPAFNTLTRKLADMRVEEGFSIEAIGKVQVLPLRELLSRHSPGEISFLSIDVEGYDLQVLQSNDWSSYRPKLVVVENLESKLLEVDDNQIHRYMTEQSYELVSRLFHSAFYLDRKSI